MKYGNECEYELNWICCPFVISPQNILDCVWQTAKVGPLGFYKGFVPAFVRLAPQTILTFMFFEQLRMKFGFESYDKNKR